MSSINVRVLRTKLISALEKKKAELEKSAEKNKKAQAEYEAAKEKWQKSAHKVPSGAVVEDVSVNRRNWNVPSGFVRVSVNYLVAEDKFPVEPTFKGDEGYDHNTPNIIKEIANAISLLNMSDEDYVPASTYKSVANYL